MKFIVVSLSLFVVLIQVACTPIVKPPLRPWEENAWYWSYREEPVLLLGGSDDDNLFQWPEKKLLAQLDRLDAAGGNVVRNTMSDRKDKGFEIYPFKRLDNGKYDLDRWNEEYWERFERFLRETVKRDIVVQIEIWDRFDYTDSRGSNRWQIHPYNPKNNVNYTYKETGFVAHYPDHPSKNKQPFFFTTPWQQSNKVVLQYQQRFVNKLLDHSLRFNHVLYCIDNETNGDEEWGRFWAEYLKRRAAEQGQKIFVTEMWGNRNLRHQQHKRTLDHPELYDYVDVSQNNHSKSQKHWDNFLYVRRYLAKKPRPVNSIKIYGSTGNRYGHTDQDGIERFWRHLLAGAASTRFHRPDAGLGLSDKVVSSIRAVRKLESLIPLWSVHPSNKLMSEREANEAYLATDRESAYVIYFPAGGEISLDISRAKQRLQVNWINIDTGEFGPQQLLQMGKKALLSPPGKENWVAALVTPGTRVNSGYSGDTISK